MIASFILLQTALTIAVGGPPTNPEYLPVRVAMAEGYFADQQLTVSLETARADAVAAQALGRGRADVAATSLEAALQLGHFDGQPPRLVFGLTAAPPVVLLVRAAERDTIRSPADLRGKSIGVTAPGTPGELMLFALLARAGVGVHQGSVQSFGDRPLVGAVESGAVSAAVLGDPWASRLIADGTATALADLRTRRAAEQWLGSATVHAAMFVRADSKLVPADLTRLSRALLRAETRIREASPGELAAKLPEAVVGNAEDFALRLDGARDSFLPDGRVTADMLAASIALARDRIVLPAKVRLPRPLDKLLLLDPLEQALRQP